jgi:hypothetical protein
LQNAPASYDFRVLAISFNTLSTLSSNSLPAQALDNLAPIIDHAKVIVAQNKPGNADTVAGLPAASNEPDVTVTLLSAAPGDPTAVVISSVISATDGSWPALGIGDNLYGQVWLQLTDAAGNLSIPLKLTNDIVGPTAPELNHATANCPNDTCRVNLGWQAGSADTASYVVNYTVDGVSHQTFALTTTSLALDLVTGKTYQFAVIGYDQFGNPSSTSNTFTVTLTRGVITTVNLVNGGPVTTTEAIPGALEVTTASVPKASRPAVFVPRAEAATPTGETPLATNQPLVQDSNNSHDWIRIFVVVILLLIIAGSFYALSRSVQETPEEVFDKARNEKKATATGSAAKRRRRRRGKPRR